MKRFFAFALMLAVSVTPASADQLGDFLGAVLRHAPHAHSTGTMYASVYGAGERLNTHTASGERFNPRAHTAAHRTLPLGTRLHVCYHGCTVVRINDRGPAKWTGRDLDLSRGAARAIGHPGLGRVRVTRLN